MTQLHAEVAIRECQPEEAEAALRLWQQAEATPSRTDTVEDLRRAIAEGPALVLVAEASGGIVESDHPWASAFWQAAGYERDARMARFVRNL